MRYYVFKVLHPSVSYDEVLKIEANTLDDAKKELSSMLNICKIFLYHIGTDEINYVSDIERMFYDARITNTFNAINRNTINSLQLGNKFVCSYDLAQYYPRFQGTTST